MKKKIEITTKFELEIEEVKMLKLSTLHLAEVDAALLRELAGGEGVADLGDIFLIYLKTGSLNRATPPLKTLVTSLIDLGCEYIEFSADGQESKDLPKFIWQKNY